MSIIAIAYPKVGKHLFLLRLYSDLRVAKNDEKVIVRDCAFVPFHQIVAFPICKRHYETFLLRWGARLEDSFGVASQEEAVGQFDD